MNTIARPQAAWCVDVVAAPAHEQTGIEASLIRNGVKLPFSSRAAVRQLPEYRGGWFVRIADDAGQDRGGFAVHTRPAPMLRNFQVLRIEELGSSLPHGSEAAVVAALSTWIRKQRKALRLSVDLFSLSEERRAVVGRHLRAAGFRVADHMSGYAETLRIDLASSESDLFQGLHHSARRKIRQIDKQPVVMREVTQDVYAARMNELLQETFSRTGGHVPERDWSARIKLSAEHPDISRIIGLFRTDVEGAESLIAYAWGCHSGDHVYYSEAASTRETGDIKVPMAYALMWDLILWSKRTGADWFDMGGVTRGTHEGDDPLGGISDFKRYFSKEIVRVRDEWILDDHSWLASVAATIHKRLRG